MNEGMYVCKNGRTEKGSAEVQQNTALYWRGQVLEAVLPSNF